MTMIATIREQDIDPAAPLIDTAGFKHRDSVRAVVMNDLGGVVLLHVTKRGFHKLPGGGVEPNEDKAMALAREIAEETGCTVRVVAELGTVIEYRDAWQQTQTSTCYLARQVGDQRQNDLTDQEREEGFEVVWATDIDAAIALLEADRPQVYDGKRIQPRDIAILQTAKSYLQQHP